MSTVRTREIEVMSGVDTWPQAEEILRLALASQQGLTVSVEMVGRRVVNEDRVLKGNLVWFRSDKKGKGTSVSFEVMHPGSTGGIRRTYVSANARTMEGFEEWVNSTSFEQFKNLVQRGKKIYPGLILDCPKG